MNYGIEDIGRIVAAMRQDAEVKEIVGPSRLRDSLRFICLDIGSMSPISYSLKITTQFLKNKNIRLSLSLWTSPNKISNGMINYNFHIGFFALTDRNYTTEQRLETTFKPVLYPLY